MAKETVASFESEMLQYPWLFSSYMPSLVASRLGVRSVVVSGLHRDEKIKEFEGQPRGGLATLVNLGAGGSEWLRERNSLLKDFGLDEKDPGNVRVLICENGVCREDTPSTARGLDLKDVAGALPSAEPPHVEKEKGKATETLPGAQQPL